MLSALAVGCVALLGVGAALAAGGTGSLLSWGDDNYGELGNGTTSTTGFDLPGAVSAGAIPAGTTFAQVAAGGGYPYNPAFGLALSSTGTLFSWGNDEFGQLGNGVTVNSNTTAPVAVSAGAIPAGTTITQIAASYYTGYALSSTGHVYAWGDNNVGQLGDGPTSASNVPVAVSAGAIPASVTITQIAAGGDFALELSSAGKVYAWGDDSDGQLGDAPGGSSNVPVAVSAGAIPTGTTITQIAAGDEFALALSSTGKVYGWGIDTSGQLGDGGGGAPNAPVALAAGVIPAGTTITRIAAGDGFALALSSTGQLYAWGDGGQGQLGDGTTSSSTPVAVQPGAIPAGTKITQIAAYFGTAMALSSSGLVYAWGNNSVGQLGNGQSVSAMSYSTVPVAVSLPAGTTIDALSTGASVGDTLAIVGDLAVSTGSPPAGTVGVPYSAAVVSATGGAGGDVWSASGLPAGLSINASSGAITGTPTAAGNATVTVTVTDADGLTASGSLTIAVTSFGAATVTVMAKTGAIGFAESLTGPGTLSWKLTFPNGSDGIFASKRKKAHKPKCTATQVRLKRKCRPATVSFGSGSTSVAAAGGATFTVTPSAAALRALKTALKRHRGVKVTATLTFQSALGGTPVSETQTVADKLAKPKPKPKHKKR